MDDSILNLMSWAKDDPAEQPLLVQNEWLITNGLGGYASGTVAGVCTRRFHGLLVAALPSPLGRMMMLNHVSEEIRLADGRFVGLGGREGAQEGLELHGAGALAEFRLESGLPIWRYVVGDVVLEKSIVLPHLQNTVFLRYRMLEGAGTVRLRIRPSLHFRPHEGRVDQPLTRPYLVRSLGRRHEIREREDIPALKFLCYGRGSSFVQDGGQFHEIIYRMENSRGYDAAGTLWSPGYLRADLTAGGEASLSASTEPWEVFASLDPAQAFLIERRRRLRLLSMAPPAARKGPAAELVLAADQFVITPNTRVLDAARTRAEGDDIRSIMAGYHWFTDWGRDTMISLEGLALTTGRYAEAGYILKMFARHVRDGLIPNLFPEGEQEGLYHCADATLWFFHALDRYLHYTGDWAAVSSLLPVLGDIMRKHEEGTRFGIGVDPADGLLREGQQGYQLTWMDAKLQDWVVTPRRGKPVEINALWYNALRLMEGWMLRQGSPEEASGYAARAARAKESFNRRFWNEQGGWLYDVIDGDEKESICLRPNQIFALSLPNPVLETSRWKAVVDKVEEELLTPVGLRSLARGAPEYHQNYDGDLRARDAAYHQGTVWAWLIGPFLDARLKAYPDKAAARACLNGLIAHLGQACLGSISEIFDAEAPFTPRGCVAQAWSVAEVLRLWVKTAEDGPTPKS